MSVSPERDYEQVHEQVPPAPDALTLSPWDPSRLLAYDIETTDLDRTLGDVTVVCLYGFECESGVVYNFLRKETFTQQRDDLLRRLDRAPRLASFNGVRFDAPFLQAFLKVSAERVGKWILKTFDAWEISKTILCRTFKMDLLLRANGLRAKSGSGLDAIAWAKNPEDWPRLEKYCLQDALLTWKVSSRAVILLPIDQDGNKVELADDFTGAFVGNATKNCFVISKDDGGSFTVRLWSELQGGRGAGAERAHKRVRLGEV